MTETTYFRQSLKQSDLLHVFHRLQYKENIRVCELDAEFRIIFLRRLELAQQYRSTLSNKFIMNCRLSTQLVKYAIYNHIRPF